MTDVRPSQKHSKRRRREATPNHDPIVIPAEVPRLLARSHLLGAEDLGRFLLLTSKSLGAALGREEAFRHLCGARYGPVATKLSGDVGGTCTGDVRGGWEWLFRQLGRGIEGRYFAGDLPELPPPQFSPQDYRFVVNIYNKQTSNLLISEVLRGERAVRMMDGTDEEMFLELEDPFHFAIAGLNEDGDNVSDSETNQIHREFAGAWECSVHVLRMTDRKGCCLIERGDSQFEWDMYEDKEKRIIGALEFHGGLVQLQSHGMELLHRLKIAEKTDDSFAYTGISFFVALACSLSDLDKNEKSVQLCFSGLAINAMLEYNSGGEDFGDKGSGVTVVHLLEQLYDLSN